MIKRTATQLLEGEHPFNSSFENNKKFLKDVMPSKSIRNKVAGYISRLLKTKETTK